MGISWLTHFLCALLGAASTRDVCVPANEQILYRLVCPACEWIAVDHASRPVGGLASEPRYAGSLQTIPLPHAMRGALIVIARDWEAEERGGGQSRAQTAAM
eukprot:scaffold549_cov385-Prasinococcus_capsulatus_cf.AAC.49